MTKKKSPQTNKVENCCHEGSCCMPGERLKLGIMPILLIAVVTIFVSGGLFVITKFFGVNEITNYGENPMPTQAVITNPPLINPTLEPTQIPKLSQVEALKLANSGTSACTKVGTIGALEVYNPNSQTWWFKLVPTTPQAGCNPACVVHASGLAEVNWRCTGLKLP